jgi:hypothetical protein
MLVPIVMMPESLPRKGIAFRMLIAELRVSLLRRILLSWLPLPLLIFRYPMSPMLIGSPSLMVSMEVVLMLVLVVLQLLLPAELVALMLILKVVLMVVKHVVRLMMSDVLCCIVYSLFLLFGAPVPKGEKDVEFSF